VDAALLLPAIRSALNPTDARSLATYQAVRRELGKTATSTGSAKTPAPSGSGRSLRALRVPDGDGRPPTGPGAPVMLQVGQHAFDQQKKLWRRIPVQNPLHPDPQLVDDALKPVS
jgi:hypothetical protein